VQVKVNEVQPGRYFSVVLEFPPGFELPAGSPVEFKAKSNHPKYAELKVPVHQAPKPAAPPAATQGAAYTPTSLVPPASIAAPPASVAAPRIGMAPAAPQAAAVSRQGDLTPPASIAAPPVVASQPIRQVLPRSVTPPPPPPLPSPNPAPIKTPEPATR